MAGIHRFLHAFFGAEFGAAGRIQHCAAAVDDIRDTAQIHLHEIPVNQAVVSTVYAVHLHAFAQSRTHDGTHSRIHTRSVSAAGQNRELLDRHRYLSPYFPRQSDGRFP